MEQGSAANTAEDDQDKCPWCKCRPRKSDRAYIADWDVWHVYCYACGQEWVE